MGGFPRAKRTYTNVMEQLVAEEIGRQMGQLPPKLRPYIKSGQVAAYALNQLPVLYASSERGWLAQTEKARQVYADTIVKAVRQGLAVVQNDPLRAGLSLSHQPIDNQAEMVLTTFRQLLNQPTLTWDDILYKCKRILLPHDHPDRPPFKAEFEQTVWQVKNLHGH